MQMDTSIGNGLDKEINILLNCSGLHGNRRCLKRMTDYDPYWPPFLDWLDRDPRRAAQEFYAYACGLMESAPPKELRALDATERFDLHHDIVVHCIADNFRVLRTYKNEGRPFAGWFYFVVRNAALDRIRRVARRPQVATGLDPDNARSADCEVAQPDVDADVVMRQRKKLEIVNDCIRKLGEQCQLLLRLAGEEFTPREIVRVLRWPADKANKVSDDLRYCRKKLVKMLTDKGIAVGA